MKKYRIKTKEEFEKTCEKDIDGYFKCGEHVFVKYMRHLFGIELTVEEHNKIGSQITLSNGPKGEDNNWTITPEMVTEVEQKSEYPKVMEVSRDGVKWCPRVVACEHIKGRGVLAYTYAESIEEAKNYSDAVLYKYACEIEEEKIVEITFEQISNGEGVGVKPHLLRLKNTNHE
jgi:hypothetical protein